MAIDVRLGLFATPTAATAAPAKGEATTASGPKLPDTVTSGENVADLGMQFVSVATVSKSANTVKDGVFVVGIDTGSDAEAKKMKRGEIVLEVQGKPVRWVREVTEATGAARASGRKAVLLRIGSDSGVRFVAIQLKPATVK